MRVIHQIFARADVVHVTFLRVHHEMCMINELMTLTLLVTMSCRCRYSVLVSRDRHDLVKTSAHALESNIFQEALECLLQCGESFFNTSAACYMLILLMVYDGQ